MDALNRSLAQFKTNNEKIDYLSERYPSLYILMQKKGGHDAKLSAFYAKCKIYENHKDPSKYSLFVHGHWLPHLQR